MGLLSTATLGFHAYNRRESGRAWKEANETEEPYTLVWNADWKENVMTETVQKFFDSGRGFLSESFLASQLFDLAKKYKKNYHPSIFLRWSREDLACGWRHLRRSWL